MTPDAASYRTKAAEMRRYAAEARDAGTRQQFLDVAAQYEKLAWRAEERGAVSRPETAHGDSASQRRPN
jgi:DNA-binding ferritin-like protein